MSLFTFPLLLFSSPTGSNPSVPARDQSQLLAGRGGGGGARSHGPRLLQRSAGFGAHLPVAQGRAIPRQPLRGPLWADTDAGVCGRSPRNGH